MKKHIEVHAPSLAECYARLRSGDFLTLQDLGKEAWVSIDINQDSKFDGSYIRVGSEIKDCKHCRHGNDTVGCSLSDLEPCKFIPKT